MSKYVVLQISAFLMTAIICIVPARPTQSDPDKLVVSCGSGFQERVLAQIKHNANPDIRPPPGDQPTVVSVDIEVVNIPSVEEASHQWTLTLYLQHKWVDPRAAYRHLLGFCPSFQYLLISNANTIESIWRPDMGFSDLLFTDTFQTPEPQRSLHVYPNGTISLSQYITATLYCNGKGSRPGQLMCPLEISPYGNAIENVDLAWNGPDPVEIDTDHIVISNYEFSKVLTSYYVSDSYADLEADFYFTRSKSGGVAKA